MEYFKKKGLRILLFQLMVLWQLAGAAHGVYLIENFSPSQYKAGIQNIDFAQNRAMTLFVANNLGVLSYNGKSWKNHDFRTGKKKRSLAFDPQTNRLYVGAQGEFGYFEEDWNYISLIDKIPAEDANFDEVWDVYLADSKVYFCTFRSIYIYDHQTIKAIQTDGGFDRSFWVNGTIYTQNRQGTIFKIQDNQCVRYFPETIHHQPLSGILPYQEGLLLFYNSGEIFYASPFTLKPFLEDLANALKGSYVNHVLQLSDGRIVVCTQTAGLFIFDPQSRNLESVSIKEGLQSSACLRAFQDFEGNLWIGLQNGISRIEIHSPTRFLGREIHLQGSGYEAYDAAEGTYFTGSNGIYFLPTNGQKVLFLPGTEGPAYGMQKITGNLYAGHHTGLFLLKNGQARKIAETEGLWQVKHLRANPGFALGGTYNGLYLFKLNGQLILEPIQKIAGFQESSRFFEEDFKGRIWVSQYYKGLYKLQLSDDLTLAKVEKLSPTHDASLPEQHIILATIDNDLYFGSQEGIYQLNQTTDNIEKAHIFKEDIGTQPIYLLHQDKDKRIHVFCENQYGFYKQISPNNYTFVPSSIYQFRYHFNNDLIQISSQINQGIYLNANEGFVHYHPAMERSDRSGSRPLLSKLKNVSENQVLYARKPFEPEAEKIQEITIPSRAKVLQFEVEFFRFNEINPQEFRYFLRGFDNAYGEWTNASTKEYTNLPEGKYVFMVQTRNSLGEEISSIPIPLQIEPPFYRSTSAKIFYGLAGLVFLLFAFTFQRRKFKRKAKTLEDKRQEELTIEQQKLDNLKRQKDRELLQLQREKIKSELRHLSNLLAASTMNLVVKNEFIENIREEINQVKSKGGNLETKNALDQIVKEIDKTLRLQEDWEQFEHHFDQVHGDFLGRLRAEFEDLTPNDQKLCAFLRLNLSTKEIANLLSISVRGVEIARYRLRKKFGLKTGQNLSKFILEY